jgi:hypothetical protein
MPKFVPQVPVPNDGQNEKIASTSMAEMKPVAVDSIVSPTAAAAAANKAEAAADLSKTSSADRSNGAVATSSRENLDNNSKKYESIADLGERAFAILTDIGAIQRSIDPSSPEYDSSKDDEIADENVFLDK